MSIDVLFKQKGVFKKRIEAETILGSNLKAGGFDGMRLDLNAFNENDFVAYNPSHIGRGIGVNIDKSNTKEIKLRLPTPTGNEELREFYDCVARIANFWKCEPEVDGTITPLSVFLSGFEDMCDFNLWAIKHMAASVLNGERESLMLFSARWPLSIGRPEAQIIEEDETIGAFSRWMHEKQSVDAYYAKPSFFVDNGDIVGRYVLTEDTISIFPQKGYVPFGTVNSETNKAIECGNFIVAFYSISENSVVGAMQYDSFIAALAADEAQRYDASNILIKGVPLERMKAMLARG